MSDQPEYDDELWKERGKLSVKIRCYTCLTWHPMLVENDTEVSGECRRYPPDMICAWPVTKHEDWCGEHSSLRDLVWELRESEEDDEEEEGDEVA